MSKAGRYFLLLICAVQLFFAVAFFFQWPLAINIWPFEGTTPYRGSIGDSMSIPG